MKNPKSVWVVILFFALAGTAYAQSYEIDSLHLALTKEQSEKDQIDILNKLAFKHTTISVAEAEKFAYEALRKSQGIRYLGGMAESFKILGSISNLRYEYSRSVEYGYEALKLFEKIGDKSGQSKVLNNLSLVLMLQKEYDRAYNFTQRSLKLKREIGDSAGVANSILTLAEYYRLREDFSTALNLCHDALNRHRLLHDDTGVAYDLFQYGEIYQDQNNYPFASTYYNDALRYARMSKNDILVITIYQRLGQLFLKAQKLDSGYVYLHRSLKLARERDSRSNEMRAYEFLTDYFETIGELDSALYYTRATLLVQQDIFSSQKSQHVASMQVLYDFEKKEQELDFQKTIVKRQFVAIIGVSLILILTVVIGVKFFRLNKANLESKESLLKLNLEINMMNENLERLVRERTEELKQQNQRLIEYAFFTAHEVRGPLARILGLVELSKINQEPEDRVEILKRLEVSAYELDEIIRMINRKLESTKKL
jgi:tetratricopeptide (TPR) repeat protein